MSLKQRIEEDLKAAMKAKEETRLGALRMIRADILQQEKSGEHQGPLPDDVIAKRLGTLAKQRREAADAYRQGGRDDLAAQEEAELAIVEAYLPKGADESEIKAAVEAAIKQLGASSPSDLGKVMGAAMGLLKKAGKPVDGAVVNRLAKEALAG